VKYKYLSLAFPSEDIDLGKVAKSSHGSGIIYTDKYADASTYEQANEHANGCHDESACKTAKSAGDVRTRGYVHSSFR